MALFPDFVEVADELALEHEEARANWREAGGESGLSHEQTHDPNLRLSPHAVLEAGMLFERTGWVKKTAAAASSSMAGVATATRWRR
ncbi:MAG: hypothetical protein AAGA48_38390 [Myxococcota bacterium]